MAPLRCEPRDNVGRQVSDDIQGSWAPVAAVRMGHSTRPAPCRHE